MTTMRESYRTAIGIAENDIVSVNFYEFQCRFFEEKTYVVTMVYKKNADPTDFNYFHAFETEEEGTEMYLALCNEFNIVPF